MATPVQLLDQCHPEYCEDYLERCHALYEGGEDWREHLGHWIPQNPQETQENYRYRASRATYENNAGSIVDLIRGGMFTEPPKVEDMQGTWAPAWLQNVDGKGTDLSTWLEGVICCAMVEQRAVIWVNLPRVEAQFDSLADQERAGALDPFLVLLRGRGIRNWGRDARGRMTWLLYRGVDSVQNGPLGQARKRYQWTAIDGQTVRVWEWLAPVENPDAEPGEKDVATLVAEVEHGTGELPLVELQLSKSLHTMGKLHDPAIALTRAQNDLDFGLHRAAHPILWVRSKWEAEAPLVGAGVYFRLRRDDSGADEMGYTSPDGASLALLASRVTTQREGMFRVVHQMAQSADGNATRAQMSGQSKEADWKATEIVLTQYAGKLRPAITQTLRIVTKLRGTEQTPTITGLEGWHQEGLMDWLLAAAQASTAVRYSETAVKMIAKEELRRLFPFAPAEWLASAEAEIEQADVNLDDYMPPPPGGGGADGQPEYKRTDNGSTRRG